VTIAKYTPFTRNDNTPKMRLWARAMTITAANAMPNDQLKLRPMRMAMA